MQERKQAKFIVCNNDCENCVYEDCVKEQLYQREYQKEYREEHKEHIKQLQRDWNKKNAEKRKTVENDGDEGLLNSSYCGIITCEGKICKLFAKLAKEKMMLIW